VGTVTIVSTRIVAALIAVLFAAGLVRGAAASAASAAAEFDHANKLYEQGKFAEAVSAYEKLALDGVATANVWFNLGNAAYKSGQMGRAIVAYRMAERMTPRDASLRANLQFVRGKIYSDGRTQIPMWKSMLRLATLNEWTVLTVALVWAFFSVLACAEAAGRRYARSALALLFAALLGGMALAAAWQDQNTTNAIIVAKEATVRFGPLEESQAAFQLRDGAELDVLSSKDDWLQVRDPEKRVGWIRRDEVVVLPMVSAARHIGKHATL